jgi:hypothetical protein
MLEISKTFIGSDDLLLLGAHASAAAEEVKRFQQFSSISWDGMTDWLLST